MKTLDVAHAEILERLAQLRPDSARQWGKMSCHQMIVHLSDSFMLPLGERKVTRASVPIPRGIFKWLALYVPMKRPHGVKTMPEMEQGVGGTPPVEFQKDREKLIELIELRSDERAGLAALGLSALRPSPAAVWGVTVRFRAATSRSGPLRMSTWALLAHR